MEAIIALYSSLDIGWQLGITIVLGLVTLAAHVLPHLEASKFGWVIEHQGTLRGAVAKFFQILAGNYRNTENR